MTQEAAMAISDLGYMRQEHRCLQWSRYRYHRTSWCILYILWYIVCERLCCILYHDDVIKWKHFPRYWPFVRGIHRWPVNSPHKGQWRRALMFPLSCFRIYEWANNREAGDLRRLLAHYDVTVMMFQLIWDSCPLFALIWLQQSQWNNPPGLLFTKRHRHLRV